MFSNAKMKRGINKTFKVKNTYARVEMEMLNECYEFILSFRFR